VKIEIFGIWDDKAKAYMQPFYMQSVALGMRAFANSVNKPDSQINVNPEDYTLFHFGSFEDTTGKFEVGPAEVLATALQVRKV